MGHDPKTCKVCRAQAGLMEAAKARVKRDALFRDYYRMYVERSVWPDRSFAQFAREIWEYIERSTKGRA